MNRGFLLLTTGVLLSACDGGSTYVLYRNSVTDETMRLHVATFDSSDGEPYNRGNCDQAKELFQAQPAVKTKFWCEKGRYRK
jgi:hypothetical protein